MAVYLVTYDLNKETTRPNITKKLRDEFPYAMLSESSYAIQTTSTVEQVHAFFKPILDDNDTFYVITLKNPWTGFGPKVVNEWLEKHLTY